MENASNFTSLQLLVLGVVVIVVVLTAIELLLGGSDPYSSTDKINKNKYIYK